MLDRIEKRHRAVFGKKMKNLWILIALLNPVLVFGTQGNRQMGAGEKHG